MITSCDFFPQTKTPKAEKGSAWFVSKSGDSILRKFWENGKLKSYSTRVKGVRNGLSKKFYTNGKTEFEINYKEGKKHGAVKWYYEDGTLYRESEYVDGKLEGIQKKYYKTGKLMAEIPYKKGEVVPGLKEYTKSGKLKKVYSKLIIEPIDKLAFESKYILRLSFSPKIKKAKYYQVLKLSNESYTYLKELKKGNSYAELEYFVSKGGFVMEKVRLRGEYKTSLGNKYVVERNYSVAVDN